MNPNACLRIFSALLSFFLVALATGCRGTTYAVKVDASVQANIAAMLSQDLGTTKLLEADSYMEDALRNALHVILSLPAYQLG